MQHLEQHAWMTSHLVAIEPLCATVCYILLLCNCITLTKMCNLKQWAYPQTCWCLGKVFMAFSSWVTVELSSLTGIASAMSWVVRLNTHAVATKWMCGEAGWLCMALRTSCRKQEVQVVIRLTNNCIVTLETVYSGLDLRERGIIESLLSLSNNHLGVFTYSL